MELGWHKLSKHQLTEVSIVYAMHLSVQPALAYSLSHAKAWCHFLMHRAPVSVSLLRSKPISILDAHRKTPYEVVRANKPETLGSIGGSYRGSKATMSGFKSSFWQRSTKPKPNLVWCFTLSKLWLYDIVNHFLKPLCDNVMLF